MPVVALVLSLLPGAAILLIAALARGRARRVTSPGARFAPADGATVLYDALMLDADRKAFAAALIDMAVQRKIRLLTDAVDESAPRRARKRTPIGVELVDGARLTADDLRVLEALFGPDHTPGRVRRFSSDGRALSRRVSAVLQGVEDRLAGWGLLERTRRTWPVVLLQLWAWIVLLVSAGLMFLTLGAGPGEGGPAAFLIALGGAVGALAALRLTWRGWRRFQPAARPLREHLAGLREYMALAEADPLRFLQSVQGAQLRADVSAEADAARLQRFLLNERLLPYAVLFGLERSWVEVLKTESASLTVVDGAEAALEVAGAIFQVVEIVGGIVQLVSAVGDLMDATGGAVDLVGGVLDAVSS